MRTGIEQVAAHLRGERLPVITSREAIEGDGDLDDVAKRAGGDHVADLKEIGGVSRLLENGETLAGAFGGGDQAVDVACGGGERLFAQDVEPGLQQRQRDRN